MIVEEYKIEIIVILLASMTAILSLIISFTFPDLQVLILTILTILLPIIYQIGYIYSKESIKAKNERDYLVLEDTIDKLEEENQSLRDEIGNY